VSPRSGMRGTWFVVEVMVVPLPVRDVTKQRTAQRRWHYFAASCGTLSG
jgi:hypothetical protein